MENEKLSDAEIAIMRVLWAKGTPMKAGEIVKSLAETHSWKTQTAHVLLSRLCNKGYIDADRSGYFHKFFPIISEEEYLVSESVNLCGRVGRTVPAMVASLISSEGISEREIDELTQLLEAKKSELQKRKDGGK
ncbi:MAG: BlaI/MecI/CopY family transcriptional regulator [Clostridia bacterium]|nr:BlaI/MecI/CopY family transcriptional regulator [Clostridia bacterium]